MTLGKFADTNLAALATLSGGAWAAAPLNLAAMLKDKDYVGTPARCPDITSLANSQFSVLFPEPRVINLAALLFHTMSLSAKYRLRLTAEDTVTKYAFRTHSSPGANWQPIAAGFSTGNSSVIGPDGTPALFMTYSGPFTNTGQAFGQVPAQPAGTKVIARVGLGGYGGYSTCALGFFASTDGFGAIADTTARVVSGPGAIANLGGPLGVTGLSQNALTEVEVLRNLVNGGTASLNWYPIDGGGHTDAAGMAWYPNIEVGSVATSRYPVVAGTSAVRPAGYIDNWQSYALDTGWADVFPSIYDPADLDWGVENWWTGTVSQAELNLYPRHLWVPFADTLALGAKIELDDRTNTAGFVDIGGLWMAGAWSPAINFSRGREITATARDLVDEAPGGRFFAEERTPRRQLALTYEMLQDAEARRWLDAAMRARTTRTVIFVPDADDPAGMMREAFPGNFQALPAPKFTYPGLNPAAVTLKEVLA